MIVSFDDNLIYLKVILVDILLSNNISKQNEQTNY